MAASLLCALGMLMLTDTTAASAIQVDLLSVVECTASVNPSAALLLWSSYRSAQQRGHMRYQRMT
jgi:hypothetical protein